jgi:hypothetical protein
VRCTKVNTKQPAIYTLENNSKLDDEEHQLQEGEEEDDNDFDTAISVSDAHDLPDGAIHVCHWWHASAATTSVYKQPEKQFFTSGERTHREDWSYI